MYRGAAWWVYPVSTQLSRFPSKFSPRLTEYVVVLPVLREMTRSQRPHPTFFHAHVIHVYFKPLSPLPPLVL